MYDAVAYSNNHRINIAVYKSTFMYARSMYHAHVGSRLIDPKYLVCVVCHILMKIVLYCYRRTGNELLQVKISNFFKN